MKQIFAITLFICVLVFSACNNNLFDKKTNEKAILDTSLGIDIKVKNNTLYFADAEAAFEAMDELLALEPEKRKVWEQKVGFISAQTELENLREQIAKTNSEDEVNQIIANNSDFIVFSENENSGIDSRIYGDYSLITGRKGIVYYGDFVSRVVDKRLYTTTIDDDKGVALMLDGSDKNDFNETKVELIHLENTDEPELKSLFTNWVSDKKLHIFMGDKAEGQWDKRAYYQLFFKNKILAQSITHIEYVYYLVVKLYCTDCNISTFTYYDNEKRKWQQFENVKINGEATDSWRIEVPYRGYTPNWYNNPTPIWPSNSEMYINESVSVYYQYFMRTELVHKIQAQWFRKINKTWQPHSNTVIQALNVKAQVQIGHNNKEHSSGIQLDNLPMQVLNCNATECESWDTYDTPLVIYNGYLSRYTKSNPPIARFKGCVEGRLKARFCPEDRVFNYNF